MHYSKASGQRRAIWLAGAMALPLLGGAAHAESADAAGSDAADQIVVTATRSGDAVPVSLLGSSITVIDAQAMEDRQTRIVSDVLRDVPGVAVNRTGAIGGLTQIRIRGAEGNQVLVFIDGIKASDPYAGEYDFSTLLADDAARIEVLRGQQSALYGSDAIGGVINYITLSGREAPGIRLRAEGGSMNTYNGSARVAGVAGDLDYALSASGYHTGGYPVAPGGSRDLSSNDIGASAKLNWAPVSNFKMTAVGRYSYTKADQDNQDIAATSPVVRGYPVITAIDTPGDYSRNVAYYGLVSAALSLFDDAWTNSLSAQIADTTRDGYMSYGRSSGDKGRRYRGSFDSTVRFGNDLVKNRFTMAIDAEREKFRNTSPGGFSDNTTHVIDTIGFVAQYDVTIADRLALGASARIDDNDRFEDDATYRATASYKFGSGTRVHAAYGTGVKAPSATELYGYSDGLYIGNPTLKPEKSTGWEAGVEQGLLGDAVTIGATYFKSRLTDQIDTAYVLVNGQYLSSTTNLPGRTRQRGVEAYAQARIGDFRVDASYTYLHAPQTVEALADPAPLDGSFQGTVPLTTQAVRRPKNIASLNVNWAPKALPVTATLTVRYNGRQRDYAFNPSYQRLLVDMRAYTLVNFNLTYNVTEKVQLYGRVENLLDRKYQEVFTFATPGRAAYGGVRLRF